MRIKIRTALILFNALFIVLTASIVLVLYARSTKTSVYSISERYMEEVLDSVKNSTSSLFSNVEAANGNVAVHYLN